MGLYNGISASLLRQLTYSTARFGIYEMAKQQLAPVDVSVIFIAFCSSSKQDISDLTEICRYPP